MAVLAWVQGPPQEHPLHVQALQPVQKAGDMGGTSHCEL